jgi:hypothetical protein
VEIRLLRPPWRLAPEQTAVQRDVNKQSPNGIKQRTNHQHGVQAPLARVLPPAVLESVPADGRVGSDRTEGPARGGKHGRATRRQGEVVWMDACPER